MSVYGLASAVAAARDEFFVALADTPESQREAFRVRHQVYCLERGFEPGVGDIETDEFDARARHVLLGHRTTGNVLGTVRIVLSAPDSPGESFPMQRVYKLPKGMAVLHESEGGRPNLDEKVFVPKAELVPVKAYSPLREEHPSGDF